MGTGKDGVEVAEDIDVGDFFEQADVEGAVIKAGGGKEDKGTAVVAAVADEDEGAFHGFAGAEFDMEFGRFLGKKVAGGDDIAQRTEVFFELEIGIFDDLSVETDAGELDEEAVIGVGEVDGPGATAANDLEGSVNIVGDAEFGGEDVHGADGEDPEGGRGAGDSVDDFIDGAVAAGGHDGGEAFINGLAGEDLGMGGAVGEFELGLGEFGADAGNEFAGTFSLGSGIEDDTTVS